MKTYLENAKKLLFIIRLEKVEKKGNLRKRDLGKGDIRKGGLRKRDLRNIDDYTNIPIIKHNTEVIKFK